MNFLFYIFFGFFSGFIFKNIINWLAIDNLLINTNNIFLELINGLAWVWSFNNLSYKESIFFVLIFGVLSGLSFVDFFTYKIPRIFIFFGIIFLILGFYFNIIYLDEALWGVLVGAAIPLVIMAFLWLITKRQGMGFGDIQLGFLLGLWLGPMRMAITLFCASALSLIVWVIISLFKGFNKDRAMPMAPYLSASAVGVFIGSFYYPNFFHLLVFQ